MGIVKLLFMPRLIETTIYISLRSPDKFIIVIHTTYKIDNGTNIITIRISPQINIPFNSFKDLISKMDIRINSHG